jgi:predicted nucleic acid-binding protein
VTERGVHRAATVSIFFQDVADSGHQEFVAFIIDDGITFIRVSACVVRKQLLTITDFNNFDFVDPVHIVSFVS